MEQTSSGVRRYGLVGHFKTIPGKRDELVQILRAAVEGVRQAAGCMVYIVSVADEPDTVFVMEVWRSKEDHDASLQNEATRLLIARALPLLDGPPEGQALTPLFGVGLEN